MNLRQLKVAIDDAVERAQEIGKDPASIPVSLQIDREDGDPVCADDEVEVHWDNNTQASGCVIAAFLPISAPSKKDSPKMSPEAAKQVQEVEVALARLRAEASVARSMLPEEVLRIAKFHGTDKASDAYPQLASLISAAFQA